MGQGSFVTYKVQSVNRQSSNVLAAAVIDQTGTPSDFQSEWFLPSLRNFTGRENELPIDAHGWYALIAPRHCLIHTAHNDGAEPTFAVEKGYIEGRSVYRLLGAEKNLRIDYRPGGHSSGPPPEQVSRADRQRNLDWIDLAFGRGLAKQGEDDRFR